MRTSLAAVTALTGSLLLPFLMLGSAQAVTGAPDLKNLMSTTNIGTVMPVRAGGGGGFVGGGRMGGMGGGHMGGRMGGFAGRGVHGPMVAGRGFNNGHFNNRHFVNDRHFHNRRFVNNRFFVAGGPWWWGYDYGYGSGCYWLRRQAIVTGSPYWWSRYQSCVGYY
jgi:hypothetical protein